MLEGLGFLTLNFLMHQKAAYVVPDGEFIVSVSELSDEQIDWYYRDAFDPQLGWTVRPNLSRQYTNRFGQRWAYTTDSEGGRQGSGKTTDYPWAATFGDSFAFGWEVSDEQTLQGHLHRLTGKSIANYGVAGYGPDQALLRMEKKLAEGLRPQVLILMTFEENLLRTYNRFRPFYAVTTPLRLAFKPRLILNDEGHLQVLTQALVRPTSDREALARAIDDSRHQDYWAETRARVEFPFLYHSAILGYFHGCETFRSSGWVEYWPTVCRGYYGPNWSRPSTQEFMDALYGRFAAVAQEFGAKPVLLFLSRHRTPGYLPYLAGLDRRVSPEVVVVDISNAGIAPDILNDTRNLHFVGDAWSLIAEHLATILVAEGILLQEIQATNADNGLQSASPPTADH